ncbi:hypothetical protein E4U60_004086 [Claviceps pazoutovae]|uniref:Uncharacterized protein n=1 Tax=Claviceps pazoutovae TaxID=1649127 RepID=A0A9P7MHQ9_9HYPO|nr:hypothetical protein E4U60_004086 [Claviceps pazoutovae]
MTISNFLGPWNQRAGDFAAVDDASTLAEAGAATQGSKRLLKARYLQKECATNAMGIKPQVIKSKICKNCTTDLKDTVETNEKRCGNWQSRIKPFKTQAV